MTEERAGLPILAFVDADALDCWLESQPENHTPRALFSNRAR